MPLWTSIRQRFMELSKKFSNSFWPKGSCVASILKIKIKINVCMTSRLFLFCPLLFSPPPPPSLKQLKLRRDFHGYGNHDEYTAWHPLVPVIHLSTSLIHTFSSISKVLVLPKTLFQKFMLAWSKFTNVFWIHQTTFQQMGASKRSDGLVSEFSRKSKSLWQTSMPTILGGYIIFAEY